MDRERLAWLRLGAALGDAAALAALWIAVVAARSWVVLEPFRPIDPAYHRPIGALLVPLWIACLQAVGSYRGLRRKAPRAVAWEVVRAAALGAVAASAALFALDLDLVSRTTLAAWVVASVPAVVASREVQAGVLRRLRRRRFDPHRVLVVGDDAGVSAWFARPEWGIEPAGVVAPDPVAVAAALAAGPVDEVFLAAPVGPAATAIARLCEEYGVLFTLDADFLGLRGRPELSEHEGRALLTYARIPRGEAGLLAKRTLDVCVGGALLVAALPLAVVIALAIRATSGAPVLFGQERVGRYGRSFTLWKFRTMVPDAEARLAELASRNELDGPAFKLRADPRITGVGRWLRRTSLDELPQLVNVLRGEMSLVGPRPPLRTEVERYERWQLRRLSMKPGLTGLWQVSGRSDVPFDRWMALDLEYIDRWSLWLDLVVLARTVPAVVRGTGAR
jgi:exopolysaccharide biosynthesis polyprenyl glycosylphosphotransferase